MTNQEAAEMIRNDMRLHHDALSGKYRQALKLAVEALIAQEPVEPWTHIDITPEGTSMVINCGACHQELAKAQRGVPLDCIQGQIKCCMRCGRAVKWDER